MMIVMEDIVYQTCVHPKFAESQFCRKCIKDPHYYRGPKVFIQIGLFSDFTDTLS